MKNFLIFLSLNSFLFSIAPDVPYNAPYVMPHENETMMPNYMPNATPYNIPENKALEEFEKREEKWRKGLNYSFPFHISVGGFLGASFSNTQVLNEIAKSNDAFSYGGRFNTFYYFKPKLAMSIYTDYLRLSLDNLKIFNTSLELNQIGVGLAFRVELSNNIYYGFGAGYLKSLGKLNKNQSLSKDNALIDVNVGYMVCKFFDIEARGRIALGNYFNNPIALNAFSSISFGFNIGI